ncbi:MAG: hypothetical protein GXO82_00160 [Chlorobi bacterium]|nr:hypothetical protein [Chlorobiota bacterium]
MTRQSRHECIWASVYGRPNEYCGLFDFECANCRFSAKQRRSEHESGRLYELPASYWLSREHLWLAPGPEGRCVIGIDHFLAESLQHVRSIIRPCTHSRLQIGKHCVWLFDIFGTISLRAPVAGVVIRSNWDLIRQPTLILTHPYGLGWLFEVRAEGHWQEGLLKGGEAIAFIQRSRNMLRDKVVAAQATEGCTVAADGGGLALDAIHQTMPDTYFELLSETITTGRAKTP